MLSYQVIFVRTGMFIDTEGKGIEKFVAVDAHTRFV